MNRFLKWPSSSHRPSGCCSCRDPETLTEAARRLETCHAGHGGQKCDVWW